MLLLVPQPPGEHGGAQHQQDIADDGADDGGLHHVVQAGTQCAEGDDQFGGVAERGIEQSAHALAGALRQLLGGPAQPAGQRYDGQRGGQEDQQVLLRCQELQKNGTGDEEQHPVEH
ncbi:hypothetical protein D3C85_724730 [compost metagenome]